MKISRKSLVGTVVLFLLIAVGVGFYFYKQQKPKEETLTVHPGEFVQQVSVSGKVVSSQELNLSFEQTGQMNAVPVSVGDHVAVGTLLASQDTADLQAQSANAKAGIRVAQAKLNQILAGATPEDLSISETAVSNAQTSVTNSQTSVTNAQDAVANARQSVFDAFQDSLTKSDDAVLNKADQLFSDPQTANPKANFFIVDSGVKESLESQRLALNDLLQSWNKTASALTPTSDTSSAILVSKKNLTQIKTFLDVLAGAVNNPNDCIVSAQSSCSPIPSSWKTDISTARSTINASLNGMTSASSALQIAQSNLKTALGAVAIAQGNVTTAENQLALKKAPTSSVEVSVYQAEVAQANASLQTIEAALLKKELRSPIDGVVTVVNAKVGAIASPNETVVSLMSANTLQIESYVPEKSIQFIKVGNQATVTLDAYGTDVLFPTTVVSLDPADTVRDGVSTYRIVLQFVNTDGRIKPGMTANVLIATEKKSNVISVPQGIVQGTDGNKTVPVKEGEATVNRPVQTGNVSLLGQMEITSGLKDGDVVVLSSTK